MTEYKKPLPRPTATSLPFWQAAKRHELQIQHCTKCGAHIFYPRDICPECLGSELEWIKVSGKGVVYSYTIARAPTHPAFAEDVPYVIAIVELAEGPRITTNIVGCKPEEVHIGMGVEATFEDVTPEITLVKFRPA
ncbi:MAG: Zn-ribbon domain-containing OB-fold protein [Candidatus Binatia bacterium]|nr:Zn-ribbon domain-containing OB-fold protein [Candidatus Binatia bacterium]